MSIFTPDEYKKEAIKLGYSGNKYMKKVKIPTSMKTIYVWCRNCNHKNATTKPSVIFLGACKQCGTSLARASKVKLK